MLAFWNSIQLRCNLLLESFWLETSSKRTWRIFSFIHTLSIYYKRIQPSATVLSILYRPILPAYQYGKTILSQSFGTVIFFWVREALELQLKSLIFLNKGSCLHSYTLNISTLMLLKLPSRPEAGLALTSRGLSKSSSFWLSSLSDSSEQLSVGSEV